jgi:hypothetical protein
MSPGEAASLFGSDDPAGKTGPSLKSQKIKIKGQN